MGKKIESTVTKYIKSLSPEEKKKYDQGREAFVIQEMFLAAGERDYDAVKELAKMIGVLASIIKDVVDFSSFCKALGLIGYNIVIEKNDSRIPL